jgi:hypothetical protein
MRRSKRREEAMQTERLLPIVTRLALPSVTLGALAFITSASALALPTCSQLATDPTNGLAANPIILSPTATLVPPSGANAAYCNVEFTFSSRGGPEFGYAVGQKQQIRIRVGLPLNSVDGGTGGVQGAWNGRTRNLGGGGCVGSLESMAVPINTRYVGSSTDGGHVGGSCLFALTPDPNKLNVGLLRDNQYDSVLAQVQWAKKLTESYYGTAATRNYWDGCSTGGRQGLAIAQEFAEELDGWLVAAPGVNYGRFRLEQIWPNVVQKDLVGGPISTAKLSQATASAVAACDALDGVTDGLLSDPRRCTWSATNNICGRPGAPATNCLTETEANAIDMIWDGPRNSKGKKVFPAFSRGAAIANTPRSTATSQIQWNHQDATYDWQNVTIENYAAEAELGSKVNGDLVNVMSPKLDKVRDGGKKILMWHGTADNAIQVDNGLNYYVRVAHHFSGGTPDLFALHSWFRYYRAPGVGHCGGGAGPQPVGLFDALVNWVENGVAPQPLSSGGAVPTRTRPLCPFPQEAVYNGSGSTDDAANFHCGGNLQTKEAVCQGLLAKYKEETQGGVDTMGTYNEATCNPNSNVSVK